MTALHLHGPLLPPVYPSAWKEQRRQGQVRVVEVWLGGSSTPRLPSVLSDGGPNLRYLTVSTWTFLVVLSLHCCTWAFSSGGGGCFLAAACRFLLEAASFVAHGSRVHGLRGH